MLSKITLALAFAFAVSAAVPASAGPRTCGYGTMHTTTRAPGPAPIATRSLRVRQALQHGTMAGSRPAIIPFTQTEK